MAVTLQQECFLGYLHFLSLNFTKNRNLPNSQKDWRYEFFSHETLIKWFLTSAKILNNILGLGLGVLNLVLRTVLPNFVRFCLILLDFYSFCCYFYHNAFQNYIVLHTLIKQDIFGLNSFHCWHPEEWRKYSRSPSLKLCKKAKNHQTLTPNKIWIFVR